MGALKDMVDLTKDLESRAKDRRDMETIHKLQDLAFSLQSNHAEIIERDIRLMEENAELKRQLADTKSEEIRIHKGIEFKKGPKTGGSWIAFCPKCHCPAQAREDDDNISCTDNDCDWYSAVIGANLPRVISEIK